MWKRAYRSILVQLRSSPQKEVDAHFGRSQRVAATCRLLIRTPPSAIRARHIF